MDLTFQEKDVIKSVIEGFTYHQKYKLYRELAKELKEDDEFAALLVRPEVQLLSSNIKAKKSKVKIPTGMHKEVR